MSRTTRRTRTTREIPMPERAPLNPTPDFPEQVLCVMEPGWEPTLTRTPYLTGPTTHYYATVTHHRQINCAHLDTQWADRFGMARCPTCDAHLWSRFWVADGLYGLASTLDPDQLDGTGEWVDHTERLHISKMMGATPPETPDTTLRVIDY